MSYSKQIGPLVISEEAGVASVSLQLSEQVGGGSVAGVLTAQVSASAQISAKQLIDAGLELAAAKFPSAVALIDSVKAVIDVEISKI